MLLQNVCICTCAIVRIYKCVCVCMCVCTCVYVCMCECCCCYAVSAKVYCPHDVAGNQLSLGFRARIASRQAWPASRSKGSTTVQLLYNMHTCYARKQICMHIRRYVSMNVYVSICMYISMYVHVYYVHTYIHRRVCMYTCMRVYINF